MNSLFDYIFYRAYKAAIGKSDVPLAYASWIVSASQLLTLLTLFSIVNYLFNLSELKVFWSVPIIIIIFSINWHRYERSPRLDEMVEKWGNEDQTRKLINGWLIIFCIAFLAVAPFLIAKMNYESRHGM